MTKLIQQEYSGPQRAWMNTWQSDDGSDLTADFDPKGAVGSSIMVIATGDLYIKNSEGKWQKYGTTEVIA